MLGSALQVLAEVLPLSDEISCQADMLAQGIEMGVTRIPSHSVHLHTDTSHWRSVLWWTKFKTFLLMVLEKETLVLLLAPQHFEVYIGSSSQPVSVYGPQSFVFPFSHVIKD